MVCDVFNFQPATGDFSRKELSCRQINNFSPQNFPQKFGAQTGAACSIISAFKTPFTSSFIWKRESWVWQSVRMHAPKSHDQRRVTTGMVFVCPDCLKPFFCYTCVTIQSLCEITQVLDDTRKTDMALFWPMWLLRFTDWSFLNLCFSSWPSLTVEG